ncbi:hypothetical protein BDN70DRAFT_134224 [Pholiota conissans]|uniref:F-box domain-containing protein n=1 Tax=Pholiota conissans TaxID=109636 RepID=A0A9P6CY08_9AGAR|nr:hypothetical protein BDN70DRAFT_134224 [Pholiota conissans]
MASDYSTNGESTDDDAPAPAHKCFFAENAPCTECGAVISLDQEISLVQYTLAYLFQQRTRYLRNMYNVHDPIVSRLPVEIVSHIFTCLVPVDVDKCYGSI